MAASYSDLFYRLVSVSYLTYVLLSGLYVDFLVTPKY